MQKEKNTYLRREYISSYKLTEEEYHLMPYSARMKYCAEELDDLLARIPEVNQKIIIDNDIPEFLDEYLKLNGCEIFRKKKQEGEGISTKIVRTSNKTYKRSKNMEIEVLQHIYNLASVKAELFEKKYRSQLEYQINALIFGIDLYLEQESPKDLLETITSSITQLSDYKDCDVDRVIKCELSPLINELDSNQVTIKRPNEIYITYLKELGYEITDNNDDITINKSPQKDTDNKYLATHVNKLKKYFKTIKDKRTCKNDK